MDLETIRSIELLNWNAVSCFVVVSAGLHHWHAKTAVFSPNPGAAQAGVIKVTQCCAK